MATCRELLMLDSSLTTTRKDSILRSECPHEYGYLPPPDWCRVGCDCSVEDGDRCWDREVPDHDIPVEPKPKILDSGERRQFETGAVRDIQEGKGRCDLMPLDVASEFLNDEILDCIRLFVEQGNYTALLAALNYFKKSVCWNSYTVLLEVSKHFEEGAKKYGENNWQKGIPTHCYIDSAVRHYLKFCRGDKDEPHDRAFVWNIMCCIWTCKHKPELNDYAKKDGDVSVHEED